MDFEWDKNKAKSNFTKHKVSFEEAKTVFDDSMNIAFVDPDHSDAENRYLVIGRSNRGRILFVSYSERGNTMRIISARVVDRSERRDYEEGI